MKTYENYRSVTPSLAMPGFRWGVALVAPVKISGPPGSSTARLGALLICTNSRRQTTPWEVHRALEWQPVHSLAVVSKNDSCRKESLRTLEMLETAWDIIYIIIYHYIFEMGAKPVEIVKFRSSWDSQESWIRAMSASGELMTSAKEAYLSSESSNIEGYVGGGYPHSDNTKHINMALPGPKFTGA